MSEYRLPSGLASVTNDCSGGYSLELSLPNKAKDRNLALHEAMEELLMHQERIAELERNLEIAERHLHDEHFDYYVDETSSNSEKL